MFSLVCGCRLMDGSRLFHMRRDSKFVIGEIKARIKPLYKKVSLFSFRKFLCLVDLKICVCLNGTRPWLGLSIKFNQYSIRSLQRALVGFNNLKIHLIKHLNHLVFKKFNWVSMSKIPGLPFKMESWTRCLGGLIFLQLQRKLYILFFSLFVLLFFLFACLFFPFFFVFFWYSAILTYEP